MEGMKRSRFTEEQIIGILKEQEAGRPCAEGFAGTGSAGRPSMCMLIWGSMSRLWSVKAAFHSECPRSVFIEKADDCADASV